MIRNSNVVRTALALAVVTLMGAGCFWLEPIAPYGPDAGENPGRPDGGGPPDGGGDPDAGVPPLDCGPETPVPAGANLDVSPGEARAWMYLQPGNTLFPDAEGLRLQLSEPRSEKVPVEVRSSAVDVVEPESEWVCIPAGESEVTVALAARATGSAQLDVVIDGAVVHSLEVIVVDGLPTFSLNPANGYYNPGDVAHLSLRLSHPSPEPVTVTATFPATGDTYGPFEFPPGAMELTESFELPPAPSVEVRLDSPELDGSVFGEYRRVGSHLLLSELLMDPHNGFIELYNPTDEPISLQDEQLVVHAGGDSHLVLTTFQFNHAVAPRSYLLVTWGSWSNGVNLEIVPPPALVNGRRLYLGRVHQHGKSMASVIDAVHWRHPWSYGASSLERKAWEDATSEDMMPGGRYADVGNAHDTYAAGVPELDSLSDFVVRDTPAPQHALSGPESFFTPSAP